MTIEAGAEPPQLPQASRRSPYEPRATLGPVTAVALGLVILGILVLMSMIGTLSVMALQDGGLEAFTGGEPSFENPALQLGILAGSIAGQIITILLCLWFAGFKGGRRSEVLALGPPAGGLKAYLLAILAFAAVAVGVGLLIDKLFPHDSLEDLKIWLPLVHSPWMPLLFVLIVVGAPLSEELLFRGFIFPSLARSRIGFTGAAVVTSALWTLPHAGYSIQGLVTIFIAGLALAAVLVKTGSLRVTILCHAIYNLGAFLFMLLFMPPPGG
jgi:hypothetical protein